MPSSRISDLYASCDWRGKGYSKKTAFKTVVRIGLRCSLMSRKHTTEPIRARSLPCLQQSHSPLHILLCKRSGEQILLPILEQREWCRSNTVSNMGHQCRIPGYLFRGLQVRDMGYISAGSASPYRPRKIRAALITLFI